MLGSKAVRRRARGQHMEGARYIWLAYGRLLPGINAGALIKFLFSSHDPWVSRICCSPLMPTLTMLMAYRDRKGTMSRGSLPSVLSLGLKLCHPTSRLGPTTLHPIYDHPISHLSRTTLHPISGYPMLHHLSHTHTTLRFHRHRIQQQRTRALCCPRICRSLTPSPR